MYLFLVTKYPQNLLVLNNIQLTLCRGKHFITREALWKCGNYYKTVAPRSNYSPPESNKTMHYYALMAQSSCTLQEEIPVRAGKSIYPLIPLQVRKPSRGSPNVPGKKRRCSWYHEEWRQGERQLIHSLSQTDSAFQVLLNTFV
jgi:hypothetical protein